MHLGHLSEYGILEVHTINILKGVPSCKMDLYKYCVFGEHCRVRFKIRKPKTKGVLDYVHLDMRGPTKEVFKDGSMYFVTLPNSSCGSHSLRKQATKVSQNSDRESIFIHGCSENRL